MRGKQSKLNRRWTIAALLFALYFSASGKAQAEASHAPGTDPDYLVVAGKSCGKISLGMSKDDVLKDLGPPTKKLSADAPAGPEIWSYEAKDQWLHLLFGANKVVQIDFTSPSFKTEEGFCTDLKSVAENKTAFAPFTVHGHPDHQRYQLRKGGFSIYALGSLTSEDEIGGKRVASVYKGSRPVVEAFAVVHEPACGWRPVENSAGAPLAVPKLPANKTIQKDLGDGYAFCQHTDAKGVVATAEVLHAKKVIDTISAGNGAILPLQADSNGAPISKDLDNDGVTDLTLLIAEDLDPPSYLLRIIPLKGEQLENKYTERFFGKKPVLISAQKNGHAGLLATDDTYVYSFGDVGNSPEPLIRVRWNDKAPFKLSLSEMQRPPLTADEISSLTGKILRSAKVKDGVFRISQEFLQAIFDLIYSGRSDDAKKIICMIWPEKQPGQWSGGPIIERDQLWFEITERLAESPYFEDLEKMNGDSVRWQTGLK